MLPPSTWLRVDFLLLAAIFSHFFRDPAHFLGIHQRVVLPLSSFHKSQCLAQNHQRELLMTIGAAFFSRLLTSDYCFGSCLALHSILWLVLHRQREPSRCPDCDRETALQLWLEEGPEWEITETIGRNFKMWFLRLKLQAAAPNVVLAGTKIQHEQNEHCKGRYMWHVLRVGKPATS